MTAAATLPAPGDAASSPEPLLRLLLERLVPARRSDPPSLWIHGVSVGEVELASRLASALHAERPAVPLLLSAATPAGAALGRRRAAEIGAAFRPFPIDLPPSVSRFLRLARPLALVLVETELWPVLLRKARGEKLPVLIANARLSERSVGRYRAAGPLFRGAIASVTRVLARTPVDADRFAQIGVPREHIEVGGDMKLDAPLPPEPAFAPRVRELARGRPVVVAGSLAASEVDLVPRIVAEAKASGRELLVLVAPRQPQDWDAAAARLRESGLRVTRRSDAPAAGEEADVFLLDTLGELGGAYRLGDVALLGGTFEAKGGHNVLEPLRAGLPVVHGPSVWNIEAALESSEGAVTEAGRDAAPGAVVRLAGDPGARDRSRLVAERLFAASAGATSRAVRAALALLTEPA